MLVKPLTIAFNKGPMTLNWSQNKYEKQTLIVRDVFNLLLYNLIATLS